MARILIAAAIDEDLLRPRRGTQVRDRAAGTAARDSQAFDRPGHRIGGYRCDVPVVVEPRERAGDAGVPQRIALSEGVAAGDVRNGDSVGNGEVVDGLDAESVDETGVEHVDERAGGALQLRRVGSFLPVPDWVPVMFGQACSSSFASIRITRRWPQASA